MCSPIRAPSSTSFPGPASAGQAPAACVCGAYRVRWPTEHSTCLQGSLPSISYGGFTPTSEMQYLLWTASLAEFPEAEFLVSLSQGLQFASLGCLRAPQKSVPGLLVPTEIPCLPASAPITCGSEQHPNLLCPVDFFSSRS